MTAPAAAFVVDEQRFLVDIAKEKPAGEPLLYDPLYDRIREARRAEDPSLPQGHWQRELKKADWPLVEELCIEALLHRSKDLQAAAWLLEAWFHLHGVAGLTEGLRVLRALCDRFWATAHPSDPDDPEVRAGPFVWLNERFTPELAARLRISEPQAADAQPYAWADWVDALRREAAPKQDAAKKPAAPADPAKPTRPKITASASLTPRAFYEALSGDLDRAGRALMALTQGLQKHAGADAPTLGRLAETLRGVREWAATVLADKPAESPRFGPVAGDFVVLETPMETLQPTADTSSRRRGIASREEAYRSLREASDYLMRTEPHSPTPFLVNRAVAWGSMSLGDLLIEFVRDGYDLKTLRVFLGLNEAAGTR